MKKILVILTIVSLIGGLVLCCSSFSSDRYIVNLALKTNDKTYLLTKLNYQIVEAQLKQNKSPVIMPFIPVFKDKGNLYINPINIKEIVELLSGNFTLHNYQEKSYDGYVTLKDVTAYQLSTENKSTEKIGEQLIEYTITLTNQADERLQILWTQKSMTTNVAAIANCKKKAFSTQTHPHPGETVTSSKNFIVVDLQTLIEFFDKSITFSFDENKQLLFIEKNGVFSH